MIVQSDSKLYKIIDSFTTMEQIVEAADIAGLGVLSCPGNGSTPLYCIFPTLFQHQGMTIQCPD